MTAIEQNEKTRYADAQTELTASLVDQLRLWRGKLGASSAATDPTPEGDRLFAAQMAARLLELSLRPSAVCNLEEIRRLVRPVGAGRFLTNLNLDDLVAMIAQTGAIHQGHFVLLSGKHSDFFFMFSRLGTRIEFRKRLAAELASRFRPLSIQSVAAPVTAGGLLLQEVASELNAEFAFYDVDDHSRPVALRRGYALHGRTAVINDMTTTGEGIGRMLRILRENGAQPVAVGLVATRGTLGSQIVKKLSEDGLKVEALLHLNIEAVPQESCEKCRLGLPSVSSADINR